MNRSTAYPSAFILLCGLFAIGCGGGDDEGQGGVDLGRPSDSGQANAGNEDKRQASSNKVRKFSYKQEDYNLPEIKASTPKPDWDYTGWNWLADYWGKEEVFKIAAPQGSKLLNVDFKPILLDSSKSEPQQMSIGVSTVLIEAPKKICAGVEYRSLFGIRRLVDDGKDPLIEAHKAVKRKYNSHRGTGPLSAKNVDYIGEFARDYVFSGDSHIFKYKLSDDKHIVTTRVILTQEKMYLLVVTAPKSSYDESLVQQWLDSFELSE